jgi:hypothetical protein
LSRVGTHVDCASRIIKGSNVPLIRQFPYGNKVFGKARDKVDLGNGVSRGELNGAKASNRESLTACR